MKKKVCFFTHHFGDTSIFSGRYSI